MDEFGDKFKVKQAEIGLIGLGVMGANLALNIAEKNHDIAVYNRTTSKTLAFATDAGKLGDKIIASKSLEELVASLKAPRAIILMIVAGKPVDEQIAALKPLLAQGDIIIDAGNANFHDTIRRNQELAAVGINFIGMGVSGGEEGARHGPSLMVGASQKAYQAVEKILLDIAAKFETEPCCALLGSDGAGHFVKTIHNGIEYADMEMIAEIYGFCRDELGMAPAEMAQVFAEWNKGRLNSYLIEITATVLATIDPKSNKPLVDMIVDSAGQKGTGGWSVIEAVNLGVPATTIDAALDARNLSALKAEREQAAKLYGKPSRHPNRVAKDKILAQLENALYAGKIAAYAQGFAVLRAASKHYEWQLPMAKIAEIWRAGCIIRSQFLSALAQTFEQEKDLANILQAKMFVGEMKQAVPDLRAIVAQGALQAIPLPALNAALAYFDGYSQPRGTANLIQGQRDFFGAHGFERIDTTGEQHGPWHQALEP